MPSVGIGAWEWQSPPRSRTGQVAAGAIETARAARRLDTLMSAAATAAAAADHTLSHSPTVASQNASPVRGSSRDQHELARRMAVLAASAARAGHPSTVMSLSELSSVHSEPSASPTVSRRRPGQAAVTGVTAPAAVTGAASTSVAPANTARAELVPQRPALGDRPFSLDEVASFYAEHRAAAETLSVRNRHIPSAIPSTKTITRVDWSRSSSASGSGSDAPAQQASFSFGPAGPAAHTGMSGARTSEAPRGPQQTQPQLRQHLNCGAPTAEGGVVTAGTQPAHAAASATSQQPAVGAAEAAGSVAGVMQPAGTASCDLPLQEQPAVGAHSHPSPSLAIPTLERNRQRLEVQPCQQADAGQQQQAFLLPAAGITASRQRGISMRDLGFSSDSDASSDADPIPSGNAIPVARTGSPSRARRCGLGHGLAPAGSPGLDRTRGHVAYVVDRHIVHAHHQHAPAQPQSGEPVAPAPRLCGATAAPAPGRAGSKHKGGDPRTLHDAMRGQPQCGHPQGRYHSDAAGHQPSDHAPGPRSMSYAAYMYRFRAVAGRALRGWRRETRAAVARGLAAAHRGRRAVCRWALRAWRRNIVVVRQQAERLGRLARGVRAFRRWRVWAER